MKKYQFDLSHPYLLHRSKETPYFFFFAAFVSFAVGLTSRDAYSGAYPFTFRQSIRA